MGMIWFAVGFYLLSLGLRLVVYKSNDWVDETGACFAIAAALFCGFCKGKFVMRKAAHKAILRLETLGEKIPIGQVFGRRYFILIAIMMSLGILLRFVDPFFRGVIDVAIGAALIHGSLHYFTYGRTSP
jgi:hypothetical protein